MKSLFTFAAVAALSLTSPSTAARTSSEARAIARHQQAIAVLRARLADLEAEYGALSEEARHQGLPAVVYRRGLR